MKKAHHDGLQLALQKAEQEKKQWRETEKQTGKGVQLSRNGFWCVPPDRRPKGWEKMGLGEPNTASERKENQ